MQMPVLEGEGRDHHSVLVSSGEDGVLTLMVISIEGMRVAWVMMDFF